MNIQEQHFKGVPNYYPSNNIGLFIFQILTCKFVSTTKLRCISGNNSICDFDIVID